MKDNPIRRMRNERKLTQARFALAIGASRTSIAYVESGCVLKIPKPLVNALNDAGLNGKAAAAEYEEWIAERAAEARKHI